LLRPRPEERLDGQEVLRLVGDTPHAPRSQVGTVSVQTLQPVPFVGRVAELGQLRAAFESIGPGAAIVVVEGESGIGKTALVRRFSEELFVERPEIVTLKGRCYERESVAYKAFDGILDALSRHLTRLPDGEAASLLPGWKSAVLAQVFPVLGRV